MNPDFVEDLKAVWEAHWGKPLVLDAFQYGDAQYQSFSTPATLQGIFWTAALEHHALLRTEYLTLYDALEQECARSLPDQPAPSFVVTGHPGIGKTMFLSFLLQRRLADAQPTAIQICQERFALFTADGPTLHSTSITHSRAIPKNAWMLIDARASLPQPCDVFVAASRATLVQITGPHAANWAWSTERDVDFYIQSLPTEAEIGAILSLLYLDVPAGIAHAREFGPCTRTVVRLARAPSRADRHRYAATRAALHVARDPYSAITIPFGSESIPSALVFLRPAPGNPWRDSLCVPTASLARHLALALLDARPTSQVAFFSTGPPTAAEWIFENYVHARLTSGRDLGESEYGGHNVPCRDDFALDDGTLASLRTQRSPAYWRPARCDFPGFDAVLCARGQVWAVQALVARGRRRPVARGLALIDEALGSESRLLRRVVFLAPELCVAEHAAREQLRSDRLGEWAICAGDVQLDGDFVKQLEVVMAGNRVPDDFTVDWRKEELEG